MAIERVGMVLWDDITEQERSKLLDMKIWKKEVFQKWCEDREAVMQKSVSKKKQRRMQQIDDEDD